LPLGRRFVFVSPEFRWYDVRMLRRLFCCAALVLVVGCRGSEPPPQEPEETVAPTTEVEEDVVVEPTEDPAPVKAAPSEPTAATPTPSEPGAAPQPKAPPRDLAAELRAAVGSPSDCVRDYRPSSATTIRVEIRAVVRATGMIIEPRASGRGLSRNDARCIEERVGAVVLAPLGGRVSTPVSTYVDVAYAPPGVHEYDVAPPPPPAENVVQALPKKKPIAPSGQPIEGPAPKPIDGPSGQPIEGPEAVPITGPKPVPIGSE
jgi:hypothetical protein